MFSGNVNMYLEEDITKLDGSLIPPGTVREHHYLRETQVYLANLINELGKISAKTLHLNKIITTDEKLMRSNPKQYIYIMKDADLNDGHGAVVGFLKVAIKNLYLHDIYGNMHKVDTLCILDFLILAGNQRKGYGKRLFERVLRDYNVTARDIAIDTPSEKMIQFLKKHYGITDIIMQSNNFAVSADFFRHMAPPKTFTPVYNTGNSLPSTPNEMAPSMTRRQFVRNNTSVGSIIHGDSYMPYKHYGEGAPANWTKDIIEEATGDKTEQVRAYSPELAAAYSPERPGSLSIATAEEEVPEVEGPVEVPDVDVPDVDARCGSASHRPAAGQASRPDAQLNDKGYFDIKYYHNQLW